MAIEFYILNSAPGPMGMYCGRRNEGDWESAAARLEANRRTHDTILDILLLIGPALLDIDGECNGAGQETDCTG